MEYSTIRPAKGTSRASVDQYLDEQKGKGKGKEISMLEDEIEMYIAILYSSIPTAPPNPTHIQVEEKKEHLHECFTLTDTSM